jgi:hypothetical protein
MTASLSLQITCEVFFAPSNSLSCPYPATANSEDSTPFNSSAPKLISWQAGVSKLDRSLPSRLGRVFCGLLQTLRMDHTENTAFIVKEEYLLIRYLAMDVLLLHAYASWECVYRVVA